MVRALLAAVLLGGVALAQGGRTATGPETIEGCVQGSGGRITLFRNNTAASFLLMGDAAKLAGLSGHQVRATGSELPPVGNHPPNDLPRFRVQRVEVMAGSCPPGAVSGAAVPRSGSGAAEGAVETPPYGSAGRMGGSTVPPGGDANVNGNAEGAPSPGTNDPRNISPSPPPIPAEVEQQTKPDTGKNAKKKKRNSGTTSVPH